MQIRRTWLLAAGVAVLTMACESPQPSEPAGAEFDALTASRGWGPGGADGDLPNRPEARIIRGIDLAPVPLDVTGKNPALVGLGSYLVQIHACSGCHTEPNFASGGNPFLGQPEQTNIEGYMAGGRPFGPFLSRNLTPTADGLPAGRTLAEFMLVMRTGVDLAGAKPLLQVMPWPYTSHMTDRELRAIYEYLRAIPCRVRSGESPDRCLD